MLLAKSVQEETINPSIEGNPKAQLSIYSEDPKRYSEIPIELLVADRDFEMQTKQEELKDLLAENQVFKTHDYDQFKIIKGNRQINSLNLRKIVQSMSEHFVISPICVNQNLEVIDGQHRLLASKILNLPVYYYICENYGTEQMKTLNLQGAFWTKQDFLAFHTTSNKEEYIQFKKIINHYNIRPMALLKVLAVFQEKALKQVAEEFDKGDLSLEHLAESLLFLEAWQDFKDFKYFKNNSFFTAFLKLYTQPGYSHERMKERLTKRKGFLRKCIDIDEYLAMLTKDIYSFGAMKNKLYYDKDLKRFYS